MKRKVGNIRFETKGGSSPNRSCLSSFKSMNTAVLKFSIFLVQSSLFRSGCLFVQATSTDMSEPPCRRFSFAGCTQILFACISGFAVSKHNSYLSAMNHRLGKLFPMLLFGTFIPCFYVLLQLTFL